MNPIEQAYKAWRATVVDIPPRVHRAHSDELVRRYGPPPLTPSERARHAVKSFWQTLTPEQRSERQRKAARKMWKRRKAERRA